MLCRLATRRLERPRTPRSGGVFRRYSGIPRNSMSLRITCSSMIVLLLSYAGAAPAQVPSFDAVGDLAGGAVGSAVLDLSSDGSVAVGESEGANGAEAFSWTLGGGITGIGFLSMSDPSQHGERDLRRRQRDRGLEPRRQRGRSRLPLQCEHDDRARRSIVQQLRPGDGGPRDLGRRPRRRRLVGGPERGHLAASSQTRFVGRPAERRSAISAISPGATRSARPSVRRRRDRSSSATT